MSPAEACLTINGAIGKAADGNIIRVTTGTFTGSGTEVVLLNKSVSLLGGWNTSFTTQTGLTTLDGQLARNGIAFNGNGFTASIDHFRIYRARYNAILINDQTSLRTLTINESIITNTFGTGIWNSNGTLIITNSNISNNEGHANCGGGIHNIGNLTISNSTISKNTAVSGGGICHESGTLTLKSTTIAHNKVSELGGGIKAESGTVKLNNTIIGENTAATYAPDCRIYITVTNLGYNLIEDTTGCSFTPKTSDRTNIDPKLGTLVGTPGYVPLLPGSPAIDKGDPATCPASDQRGVTRPQGNACDMGAYEWFGHTISGNVGVAGALLKYYDSADLTVKTASNGNYSLQVSDGWSGKITPFKLGYAFTPASKNYPTPITSNLTNQNYTNIRTGYVISGNAGIAEARILYTGLSPNTTILTDQKGNYAFAVAFDWSGTVTPSKTGYRFSPENKSYTNLNSDQIEQNYALSPNIPNPLSPTGMTADSTPAYTWSKILGATHYQYELWAGNDLIYKKTILASKCATAICSDTPTNFLPIHVDSYQYQWHVQAMIDGVWKNFSPYKIFTIKPTPGHWLGKSFDFYVSNNRAVVHFSIYVYIYGCGSYRITHTNSIKIVDNHFEFTGTYYANGTFDSLTTAHGQFGLSDFYLPGCGYLTGGPFPWTADWEGRSQPALLQTQGFPVVIQQQIEPVLAPHPYIVERVSP